MAFSIIRKLPSSQETKQIVPLSGNLASIKAGRDGIIGKSPTSVEVK